MRSCNRLNSDPKLVGQIHSQSSFSDSTDERSIGKSIFQPIIEEMEVFSHGRLESTVQCTTSDGVLPLSLSSRGIRIASIPFTGIQPETRDQRTKIRVDPFVFPDEIGLQPTDLTWRRLEDGEQGTSFSDEMFQRMSNENYPP